MATSKGRIVGTHWAAHHDEFVMFLVALAAGWNISEFRFYRSGAAAIAAQEADPSIALFGIGGRENVPEGMFVCDEHDPEGRIEGECGGTLLAKKLNVADRPELREILAYAHRADTQAGQKHLELAQALKTLHGYSGFSAETIWEQVVHPCYRAIIAHARGDAPRPVPEFDTFLGSKVPAKGAKIRKLVLRERPDWESCVAAWVILDLGQNHWDLRGCEVVFTDDINVADAAVREKGTVVLGMGGGPWGEADGELGIDAHAESLPLRVIKEISGARKSFGKIVFDESARWYREPAAILSFELPSLIERLRAHGELDSRAILKMAMCFLSSTYARAQAFRACGKIKPVVEKQGEVSVTLAVTDNREAWGALGGKEKNVLALRKESGNMNLRFTPDLHDDVLAAVARGLIVAESAARGENPDARIAALEAAGARAFKGFALMGKGDETWYLVHGGIHNATETHPDVPPTKLTAAQVVAVVKEAIASVRA